MSDQPEDRTPQRLTHVREDGTAHMVDVSEKAVTSREATAQAVL
ncbi:cyclic pyranopterin monophosphate synthase MoaC, partial [Kocuria rhizophila]